MIRTRTRRGSVMMEFVVAAPILLLLITACVQFAHLWLARLMTNYAAYSAARAALVTVCDQQGPSKNNDSWPTRDEMPYQGYQDAFTHLGSVAADRDGFAKSEADWAASEAAKIVCGWTVLGAAGQTMKDLRIPGWGNLPGTDAAERKVRAVVKFSQWNVTATVEQDFALVLPIVGPVIAWGMNPWDDEHPWAEQNKDGTDDAHRSLDRIGYPHVRIVSTVTMPKPYRTIIATGNWKGTPPGGGPHTGW